MKYVICALASLIMTAAPIQAQELPASGIEILNALEHELDEIRTRIEADITATRERALQKLKEIQDSFTREGRLDDAVLIRDKIRSLNGAPGRSVPNRRPVIRRGVQNVKVLNFPSAEQLPAPAAEIVTKLEQETNQIRSAMEIEFAARSALAIPKLQEIQDRYTREAKLDEAIEIRNVIRNLQGTGQKPLPDPGTLMNHRGKNGKCFLFEVIGTVDGTVFGTDIYTDDSDLSTAAVHANVLRPGEKGILKVTILPAQAAYVSSESNGVISADWAGHPGSYKVERQFGSRRSAAEAAVPIQPAAVPADAAPASRPRQE